MASNDSIVLIDGENFMYRLFDVLKSHDRVGSKLEIISYDFDGLLAEVLGVKESSSATRKYFGTRIRQQSKDKKTIKYTEDMIQSQRRWKRYIEDRGTEFVYAGNLRLKEGKSCRNCGKKTLNFVEKGVDVAIATELLNLAADNFRGNVYLISSDSDLLPAIQSSLKRGLNITYVTTETSVNFALSKAVRKISTMREQDLHHFWEACQ